MTEKFIIGIDEVGRGSAIGELTVCGVRARGSWKMEGLADSKQLTPAQREAINQQLICSPDLNYTIASRSHLEIDQIGLGKCLKLCYVEIIEQLYQSGDEVVLDGNLSPRHLVSEGLRIDIGQVKSVIKADTYIPVVMAASVIAKVHRDTLVKTMYHPLYPCYGWESNMGYLSLEHRSAIKQHGLTELHRKSYKIKL